VLGLWSACASVGNIIGALMVSQVLHYGYDVSGNRSQLYKIKKIYQPTLKLTKFNATNRV